MIDHAPTNVNVVDWYRPISDELWTCNNHQGRSSYGASNLTQEY